MNHETKVRRIGNSLGVILPGEVLARLRVGEGEALSLVEVPGESFRLAPGGRRGAGEAKAAEAVMRRYRPVLRALARAIEGTGGVPASPSKPSYRIDTVPTPLGDFSVALDESGAVAATAFGGEAALRDRFEPGPEPLIPARAEPVRRALAAYFSGKATEFALPLAPVGSPFQRRVWASLQEIPRGETRSYGEIATRLGSAPRAVGRAIGSNPICLFIPCHRVIGADGSLTGYAFGEERKRRLLAAEGALLDL